MKAENTIDALFGKLRDAALDSMREHDEQPWITRQIAQHVLGFYGCEGGLSAGDFTRCLLQAIARADNKNRELLAVVYPLHVAYMVLMQDVAGGVGVLQGLVVGLSGYQPTTEETQP